MSPLDVTDNKVADTQRASSAYVPPLQRTEGQPPPIAANGGLSYMAFDRDGDAGTAKAIEDALAEIAAGEGQRVSDMIERRRRARSRPSGASRSAITTSA
jgi:hypothetical protein